MADSHIEALAMDYLTFGIFAVVNNLWTWIAVVTAAISVWKMTAANEKPKSLPCSAAADVSLLTLASSAAIEVPSSNGLKEVVSSRTNSGFGVEEHNVRKGKVMVYLDNDDDDEEEEDDNGKIMRRVQRRGGLDLTGRKDMSRSELICLRERAMRMKKGDFEWYRDQDLRSLNGNVVRFWDETSNNCTYASSCFVYV